MLRRLLWVLVALAGVVLVAVVGVSIALSIYLTDARLTATVRELLSNNLLGRFELARAHYSPPFGLEVDQPAIFTPEGEPVLRASKLTARIRPLSLLSHTVSVESGAARDVWVRVGERRAQTPEAPSTGLGSAFAPKHPAAEAGRPWKIYVDGVNVDRETLELATSSVKARLLEIEIRGGGVSIEPGRTQVRGSRLKIDRAYLMRPSSREEGPIAIEGHRVRYRRAGESKEDALDFDRLTAKMVGSAVDLHGQLSHLASKIDAKLGGEASLSLADPMIESLFPAELRKKLALEGKATLRFDADGSYEEGRISHGHASLDAEGTGLRAYGLTAEHAAVKAQLEPESVVVKSLALQVLGGKLSGTGTLGLKGDRPGGKSRFTLDSFPIQAVLKRWIPAEQLPRAVSGVISLDGPLPSKDSATPTKVQANLQVIGPPGVLSKAGFDPLKVDATARIGQGRVQLDPLTAGADDAKLTARGALSLDAKGPLDLHLNLVGRGSQRLIAALGLPLQIDGQWSLDGQAKGTFSEPVASGLLTVTGVHAAPGTAVGGLSQIAPATLRVPLRFEKGVISVRGGTLTVPSGKVGLEGRFRVAPDGRHALDADLRFDRLELAAITAGRLRGQVVGDARLSGRWPDLSVAADLRGAGLAIRSATIARAHLVIAGAVSAALIAELDLLPEGGGRIRGSGRLLNKKQIDATLRAQRIPAEWADGLLAEPLGFHGRLELAARAVGTLDAPNLVVRLGGRGLALGDLELGTLSARAAGGTKQLDLEAALHGKTGDAELTGVYEYRRRWLDARLETEGIDLRALSLALGKDLGLDGRVTLGLIARGPLPLPELDGAIHLSALTVDGQPVPEGRIDLAIDTESDGGAKRRVRVRGLGFGKMRVDGIVRPEPFEATLRSAFDDFDPLLLLPDRIRRDLRLQITGSTELSYRDTGEKRRLSGKLDLSSLSASEGANQLHNDGPIAFTFGPEGLRIGRFELAGSSGRFSVRGWADGRLALVADGRLELGFLAGMIPALGRASGTAELHGAIGGTSAAPEINGEVALVTPLKLQPRGFPQPITLDQGRVLLQPSTVELIGVAGAFGSGRFKAGGRLGLEGFLPRHWDLLIEAQNLPFRSESIALDVNARLRGYGEGPIPKLIGTVDILRGRYLKRFELQQFNLISQGESHAEPLGRSLPWLQELELDIRAESAGAVDVRVALGALKLVMNLSAKLHLTGTADAPLIEGRIVADEGTLELPTTRLDVSRASIDFTPTPEGSRDPQVSLRAEGEVPVVGRALDLTPSYFATLSLDGKLDELVLNVTSEPPLSRLDGLALLITGHTNTSDLLPTPGAPSSTSSRLDSALVLAGSQLAAPLDRFLEKELFERLNFPVELGTEVTSEGLLITAGREITRRFRIRAGYLRAFAGEESGASGSAQLLLSDKLFLEGSAQRAALRGFTLGGEPEGRLELKLRVLGR